MIRTLAFAGLLLGAGLILFGCESDNPALPIDEIAPGRVTDLYAIPWTDSSVIIQWTAPGNDNYRGSAKTYQIAYGTDSITAGNWASQTMAENPPIPKPVGGEESYEVKGLDRLTTYYFALRAADETPNWSEISNLASTTTPESTDVITPAAITTLLAVAESDTMILLTWIATGDDSTAGTAHQYALGYGTSKDAVSNWNGAEMTVAVDLPTPEPPDTEQAHWVTGLQPGTTYFFNLRIADEIFQWSESSNIDSATTTIVLDSIPPDPIAELATVGVGETSITLSWTASGDDSSSGTASQYDIRYATTLIADSTWDDALPVAWPPTPQAAGAAESFTIYDLTAATTYYMAMKVADEMPNWSALSDVDSATTALASDPLPLAMALVAAGAFDLGDTNAPCGAGAHRVVLPQAIEFGQYELTTGECIEMLQWAHDEGYITATTTGVYDRLDGSTLQLIDLNDADSGIAFSDGLFSFRSDGLVATVDHPVVEISWYGAAALCDWLSLRAGLPRAYAHDTWTCRAAYPHRAAGYRLPTDAEWEYVTQYQGPRTYPWGNEEPDETRANYGDLVGVTMPVGSYPNGVVVIEGMKVYDLAGNLYEWCHDYFTCDLGTVNVTNPSGPISGSQRVIRGGAWSTRVASGHLRCAARSGAAPTYQGSLIGVRVVRTTP